MKRRSLVFSAPALLAGSFGVLTANAAHGAVVKFGQSASLTGAQAAYGRDVRDGIQAAFEAASTKDVRYELVTLDDGGVKDRCVQNVSAFVASSDVSAIIGLTSGVAAEACVPTISRSQIALLGTASGNMGIRSSNVAYHVRAGYDLEYLRMASYMKEFGMRRVGVVHLQGAGANLQTLKQTLSDMSISPIETFAIDRNVASLTDVSKKLLSAKLDCVLLATNAAPARMIIEDMRAEKYAGLFYASSFAGQELLDDLSARKLSCVMSLVVPRPSLGRLDVVNRCRQDILALGTDAKMGTTTLEGYITGRTAVEAAKAALKVGGGERVSRARMKESLANLRTDLGGYRVEFGPGSTQGSQFVDLIALDRYGRLVG